MNMLHDNIEPLPSLIEPEQLWHYLQGQSADLSTNSICVLDVSRPNVYQQVHIPYAISVSPKELVRSEDMATGLLPDDDALQAFVNRVGLSAHQQVVVYDDEGGAWAGRLLWNLHCMGFYRVSLLNGGIHAWLAAHLPVSNHSPDMSQIDKNQCFQIDTRHQQRHRILLDELQQRVLQPTLQLWDCRSPAEYCGERLLSRRGGHIPNAINFEWSNAVCRENQMKLYPLDRLQQQLIAKGFDFQKDVVVYCQSHHRSGLAYTIAHLLGWSVRAYDGSWSQWGNRLDTQVIG